MLKKCLRYDIKSVFPYWLIGAITMLVASIPGGLALRSQKIHAGELNRFQWEILVIILVYFIGAAFFILSSLLIYVRFYKHFFSDEGYLTFTLPVKRRTLFTSKVINGVIWQASTVIVVIASIIIMYAFVPLTDTGVSNPSDSADPEFMRFAVWLLVYLLEAIIFIVIYAFSSVITMYLIITFGANIVRKNKIIATIGIAYVSSIVSSIITYVFSILGALYITSIVNIDAIVISNMYLLVFFIIAFATAILLTFTVGAAMLTLHILERKLNLA